MYSYEEGFHGAIQHHVLTWCASQTECKLPAIFKGKLLQFSSNFSSTTIIPYSTGPYSVGSIWTALNYNYCFFFYFTSKNVCMRCRSFTSYLWGANGHCYKTLRQRGWEWGSITFNDANHAKYFSSSKISGSCTVPSLFLRGYKSFHMPNAVRQAQGNEVLPDNHHVVLTCPYKLVFICQEQITNHGSRQIICQRGVTIIQMLCLFQLFDLLWIILITIYWQTVQLVQKSNALPWGTASLRKQE